MRRCVRLVLPLVAVGAICFGVAAAAEADHAAAVPDGVVVVDGAKFTLSEIQRKSPGSLFQARNALYDAERKAADEFVDEYLLEREAKKAGLTVDQLLEQKVYVNLPKDPSDEALRFYYDGIDTSESYDAVKDKIRDTIRERRMAKAKAAYVRELRKNATVSVAIAPPRADLVVDNAPLRGSASAAVTVVEYADYECPYCQQIQPVVARLESDYKGKIAFVFKDVPLPMHAHAQKAAEAAHCAGEQGKFWEYHDLLFSTKEYDLPQLKDHARELKLDQSRFNSCLDSGSEAARIKTHIGEAQAIGLPGTPGFFVNGRFLNGAVDYQVLRKTIEEELAAASTAVAEAARPGLR